MNDHDTVSYRPANQDDFPVLKEMYAKLNNYFYQLGYRLPQPEDVGQVWLDSFQRTLGRFSNVHVAELNGDVVGFVLSRVKRTPAHMGGVMVGELSDIWIEPQARRMGIGNGLSRLALNWLREQGVHSVEVQVLRDNQASRDFFEHMGFKLEFRVARLLWEDYVEDH